ncbi:unnamed protein product, partial [Owenia fusiformis]
TLNVSKMKVSVLISLVCFFINVVGLIEGFSYGGRFKRSNEEEEEEEENDDDVNNSKLTNGDDMINLSKSRKQRRKHKFRLALQDNTDPFYYERWPNNEVTFYLSTDSNYYGLLNDQEQKEVQENLKIAMEYIMNVTSAKDPNTMTAEEYESGIHRCINFKRAPLYEGKLQISIIENRTCQAEVGYVDQQRYMFLHKDCFPAPYPRDGALPGYLIHELLHILGMLHEHMRPDRDDYVTILRENLFNYNDANFEKMSPFNVEYLSRPYDQYDEGGYDYYSIMHYYSYAKSKNRRPTMELTNPLIIPGQRRGMTYKDAMKLARYYNCPDPSWVFEYEQPKHYIDTRAKKVPREDWDPYYGKDNIELDRKIDLVGTQDKDTEGGNVVGTGENTGDTGENTAVGTGENTVVGTGENTGENEENTGETGENTVVGTGENTVVGTGENTVVGTGENTGENEENTGETGENTGVGTGENTVVGTGENTVVGTGENTGETGENTGENEENTGETGENTVVGTGENTIVETGENTGENEENTGQTGENTVVGTGENTGETGENTGKTLTNKEMWRLKKSQLKRQYKQAKSKSRKNKKNGKRTRKIRGK